MQITKIDIEAVAPGSQPQGRSELAPGPVVSLLRAESRPNKSQVSSFSSSCPSQQELAVSKSQTVRSYLYCMVSIFFFKKKKRISLLTSRKGTFRTRRKTRGKTFKLILHDRSVARGV